MSMILQRNLMTFVKARPAQMIFITTSNNIPVYQIVNSRFVFLPLHVRTCVYALILVQWFHTLLFLLPPTPKHVVIFLTNFVSYWQFWCIIVLASLPSGSVVRDRLSLSCVGGEECRILEGQVGNRGERLQIISNHDTILNSKASQWQVI